MTTSSKVEYITLGNNNELSVKYLYMFKPTFRLQYTDWIHRVIKGVRAPAQTEFQLRSLEQAAGSIGLYVKLQQSLCVLNKNDPSSLDVVSSWNYLTSSHP